MTLDSGLWTQDFLESEFQRHPDVQSLLRVIHEVEGLSVDVAPERVAVRDVPREEQRQDRIGLERSADLGPRPSLRPREERRAKIQPRRQRPARLDASL